MVGLYESVLLKILERDEVGPKIIGATATLSLEGSQSKNLYRGKDSSIFPPQVLLKTIELSLGLQQAINYLFISLKME